MTRRELLLSTAAVPLAAAVNSSRPALCLFSKHLPDLGYEELGKTVREFGFDGVDLTVRPRGHVLPERVAEDLPRAVKAIRGHGLSVPMITTGLLSAADPVARPTLATAARLKIPYFKPGYWRYGDAGIEERMAEVREATKGLVALASEYGIEAGFHNHSGDYVGTATWDTREIIGDMDPRWIGYYFDPCHATAEGGRFGWRAALGIAIKRLKMIALKDFYWEKTGGNWRIKMCPLGEGMVDWDGFFGALAKARFTGPISLHVEYDPADEMEAIAKDLAFMKRHVKTAYGG
jgi:sugar phosphate isomerase/epimerase